MQRIHKGFIVFTLVGSLFASPLLSDSASAARLNPYPPSTGSNNMSCNPNYPVIKNQLPPCSPYVSEPSNPIKDDTSNGTITNPTNPTNGVGTDDSVAPIVYYMGKDHRINLDSYADRWEIKSGTDVVSINEYGIVTSHNYGTAIVYFYHQDGSYRVYKIIVEPYTI